jgi:uncharacterized protein (PEP-CTERM system associated)
MPAGARGSALALAVAVLCLPGATRAQEAPPAPAETVLPRTGPDPGPSVVDDPLAFASPFAGPAPPPLASEAGLLPRSGLIIEKQIGVSEELSSNVGQSLGGGGGRGGYDFITLIQPSVTILDATQRLSINLTYDPTVRLYARNFDYSQFQQQGSGDILGTVLPDWIFVDLRGSASQQSVYGGYGQAANATLAPDDRETQTNVSVTPYATHGFGGIGSAQAGVAYLYSATDAPGSAAGAASSPFGPSVLGQGNYGSSYLATERAFANFETGEDLGRLRDKIGVDANRYDGAGALQNARRINVTDDASYALTRRVALLGEIGYEDLAYPASDFRYNGPTGAGGLRLSANRDSRLVVEYRYIDGFGSAFAQLSWQATERIRLTGGYSEGISTELQDQQDTLLSSEDEATGITGAAASGVFAAPLLGASNSFGGNQDLHKIRRIDANFIWIGPRDTLSLTVQSEQTTPVGRTLPGTFDAPTSGVSAGGTWSRPLNETTSISASLSYASNRSGLLLTSIGRGGSLASSDTLTASATVSRVFTKTITGYVSVNSTTVLSGYDNFGGQNGNEADIIVGLVKRF